MIHLVAALSFLLSSFLAPECVFAARGDNSIEDELKLKAGDESGNELKAMKTEILVMRAEKKALEQLQKLRIRHKGTRMEPEILFRLGEIHMRRARTERFFEIHRDSANVVRFAPELVKQASEVAEIRKAIEIYLDIQKRFPRFRAGDTVAFNNAYAYQQIGDTKNAEAQFHKLLKEFADSPLVPDTLLSVGEINYQRRAFVPALEYFLKIKEYPQARVYPYGLYKAAWTKYNLQNENGGIALLEETIAFGHERAKEGGSAARLDLRKEALNDLALFFSEARKPDQAVEYFTAQARDLDPVPFILRLVDIYERHAKYVEVDTVLRGVLAKSAPSTQIALVHEKLIWNADRQKRRDLAVKQLGELDRACEAFDKKDAARGECVTKTVEVAKKLGAKFHAYWKKDRSNETADAAMRAYEIYLSNNTVIGHESAQVRYALSDLLFVRGRFREASTNYAYVNNNPLVNDLAKESGDSKSKFNLMTVDPKLSVDAAYGAILSLEKAVGDREWSSSDETLFGDLADQYLSRAPQGPYALDVRFKRSFIAYEKTNYDKAAIGFKAIGWATYASEAAASNPKVLKAQDLYLDILNIKKDYKTLKESAQALLSRSAAGGVTKEREVQLSKIRREAWFAEVADVEQRAEKGEKGQATKAVEMYKTFALENKGTDLAPRAWWNASQLLFKTGDAAGGAQMCAEMNQLFPTGGNTKQCLQQAANTFEAIARLDLAAKVVLNLAELEPEKKTHWREVASDFFALSGTREGKLQSLQMLMKIVDEKKPENKLAVLEKAMHVAKELKDSKQIAVIRERIESQGLEPAASRFLLEEAQATYANGKGDPAKTFSLTRKIVGRESQLRSDKSIAARARFIQAQVLEDEYRAQSVKARVERIGIVLALKTEKLEKAQKAFQAAAKMGDDSVAIESYAHLADMYVDFAKTVKAMTLPADVPAADQQAFMKEIETIAMPMEEKGIDTLNQAIEAAKKSARLDGLAGALQEKLDRLNLKADSTSKVEVQTPPRVVPMFRSKLLGFFESGPALNRGGDL